jgi:hypothetical protein
MEGRIGTLGPDGRMSSDLPAGIRYPVAASWQGGLDAPQYGSYRLSLSAPARASLILDGQRVLAASGPRERTVRVVLARGVHTFTLSGRIGDPRDGIALRWGATSGPLLPIGRTFLWHAPLGVLLANDYEGAGVAAITAPQLDTSQMRLISSRRDGVLGFHNFNLQTGAGTHAFADWRGIFIAPTSGTYVFDAQTDGLASIWADGRLIGANAGGASTIQASFSIHLTGGVHRFEVRLLAAHDNQTFELYWRPPDGQRAILPPTSLAPAAGGVWSTTARPLTPSVDETAVTGKAVVRPVT